MIATYTSDANYIYLNLRAPGHNSTLRFLKKDEGRAVLTRMQISRLIELGRRIGIAEAERKHNNPTTEGATNG